MKERLLGDSLVEKSGEKTEDGGVVRADPVGPGVGEDVRMEGQRRADDPAGDRGEPAAEQSPGRDPVAPVATTLPDQARAWRREVVDGDERSDEPPAT